MEFKKTQSIYLQIGEMLSQQILSEQLLPESKIPSVREMAANLQVNPNTIMRTYTSLQEKGIILNKRGIGFFVAAEAKSIITQQQKDQYLIEDLPQIIKKIILLDIDFDSIKTLYDETKASLKSPS